MKSEEILRALCERNGLEYEPVNENGTIALQVGEGPVLIVPDSEQGELNVLAAVGEPLAEGTEAYDRQALEENFRLAASGGAFLSFDSESDNYVVCETVATEGLKVEALQGIVTGVAALLDSWRGKLREVSPAAPIEFGGMPVGEGIIRA